MMLVGPWWPACVSKLRPMGAHVCSWSQRKGRWHVTAVPGGIVEPVEDLGRPILDRQSIGSNSPVRSDSRRAEEYSYRGD